MCAAGVSPVRRGFSAPYTDYCAAKFAVIGFSDALRWELAPHRIAVSVLCPPDVDTPGLAQEEELVPFGGEHAHKAFALALGLQLLVDALVRDEGHGAVLLVAQPAADPVPALRDLAGGVRLPGDSK